jgi:hypothetical protein
MRRLPHSRSFGVRGSPGAGTGAWIALICLLGAMLGPARAAQADTDGVPATTQGASDPPLGGIDIQIDDPTWTLEAWEENIPDIRNPELMRRAAVTVIPTPSTLRHRSREGDQVLDVTVRSDTLVVFVGLDQDVDGDRLLEVYVAGNVRAQFRLSEGSTLLRDDLLRCSEGFVSFEYLTGVLRDAKLRAQLPNRDSDIYVRAREFRVVDPNHAVAEDVLVSLTPYLVPGLHLRAERLRFRQRGTDDVKVVDLQGTSAYIRNTMISPLVPIDENLVRNGGVIRRVDISQSDRTGFTVYADFDYWILIHDVILGRQWERARTGRIHGGFTAYSARGVAPHLGFDWSGGDVRGEALAFYLHDAGDDTAFGRERGFFPLERADRFRGVVRHRQKLPLDLVITGQLSYFSDRNLLVELFKSEFNGRLNQESFADVARYDASLGFRFFWRQQVNDYQRTLEYKPRVQIFLNPLPIVEIPGVNLPVYVDLRGDVARIVDRPARGSGDPTRRTNRLHLRGALSVPIDLGVVAIVPELSATTTWYDWDVDIKDVTLPHRTYIEARTRLFTNIFRTFDAGWSLMNVSGLRHVIIPEIIYTHRFPVTFGAGRTAAGIPQFDDLDGPVDGLDVITVYLTNKIQGRRGLGLMSGRLYDVVDLITLRLEASYFPGPDRDNDNRRWGPLIAGLTIAPITWHESTPVVRLALSGDLRYDIDTGVVSRYGFNATFELESRVDNASIDRAGCVAGRPCLGPLMRLDISHRIIRDESVISGVGLAWRASPAYRIRIAGEYDFDAEEARTFVVEVQRLFQEFALNIAVKRDLILDDTTVSLSVSPLGFADDPDLLVRGYSTVD